MENGVEEGDLPGAEPAATEPILTAAAIAAGAGGVVTVMHVDVEGSTALTAQAGDEVGRTVLSSTKQLVQARGEASGGTLIDAVGDAMMLTFTSTRSAITAAIGIQDALTEREAADPETTLRVRIGLNVGEVVGHDATPFGAAVNAGARVMSMADGGEILVSEMVRRLAGTVPGVDYRDRGRHRFKGFDEPWRVYQVLWPGAQPPRPRGGPRRSQARWIVVAALAGAVVVAAAAFVGLRDGGTSPEVEANSVARLDGDSGAVRLAAPIGQRPGASAIGFDSLWVAQPDRGVVVRVDLEDGSVRDTVRVGASPAGVAVGGGAVWVTNSADGTVSRISPAVNEVTQTLPAGTAPSGIAYGSGALWVADTIGAALVRLDPTSGRRDAIPLAGRPSGVAFSPDGVWVTFDADGVARVDPRSRSVTFTKTVGNGPTAVLSALGAVWVANHLDGTVSRLEPSTGRLEATIPVGDGPSSLALAAGSIWVANELDDSVTSIDPKTSTQREVVPTGGAAVSLAADGDDLWLAAGASALEHRGGTLRVSFDHARPVSLDPAIVGDEAEQQILSITSDGLVAYRKVGGPDGATLVPDLASALPEVSADGRSYRFPLRQGIRYSTGDPVQPQDFRRGLERAIVLNEYAAELLGAIDGAEMCARRKAGCDLSGSVVADDEAVTIRLARPDPDLPFKLALPFAFPVPAATPMRDQRLKPIPATGPYVVTKVGPDGIELGRNGFFEEWSGSAQPDGFVDAITWRFGESVDEAFDRLEAGTLDWMGSRPSPQDLASLQTAHPDRIAFSTGLATVFAGVDVMRPPFADVRMRRALNYAVDRARIVELAGGDAGWRATCQIFPPTIEGYVALCPYTSDPGGDVWTAPDLARAKGLVEAAGADGRTVTVSVADLGFIPGSVEIMRHVVDVLNEIGLRATLRVVPDADAYLASIYGPTAEPGSPEYPHVFLGGWLSEFPRASDFIEPQFRCGAPENTSGYCNRRLDRAIDRVKRLATTNPGAASRGWTAIEHSLVRDAVWAPLMNPVIANAFSARVGNVQVHPKWGVLLSQLWVQ
jgi:peptide/nickel transport system substrate-binding protein